MTKKLVMRLKKDGKFGLTSEQENDLKKYKNVPGVWALYGRSDCKEICLEVAQTSDIYDELTYDLDCICKDYSKLKLTKSYNARRLFSDFSESFDVCTEENRVQAKYRDIAMKFSELMFYIICEGEKEQEKREQTELEFAITEKAIYWNAWGKQRKQAREFYKKTQERDGIEHLD